MSKLVRDKIPEIIEKDGKKSVTHIASDEEYWGKLKEKLKEEVEEFFEDSNEEELADILEVVDAIKDFKEYCVGEVKRKKFEERGGFSKKIILDGVR